jgi:two-component system, NtrC family, response regulator HydG
MNERSPRVVVVDDKVALAETLADGLMDHGFDASALGSGRAALEVLRSHGVDVLVTDLRMPDVDGLTLLDAARVEGLDAPVIVMTAHGAVDSAVESIRRGAFHYLTKPFKLEELVIFVRRALADRALRRNAAELRRTLGELSISGLVARSSGMQRVLAIIERVAPTNVPILLTGETGTGKGAVARTIHNESRRAARPFVAVNCAAIPEALLESELFGHVKGAFTGATHDHAGLFAEAEGGTLLLDEIGEMSSGLQAKLLHVLESGKVRPVGSTRERVRDVRIIAATHRDLRSRIAEGSFREDLMYRLDVMSIVVPPLRDRTDDIAPFVERFLVEARDRHPTSTVQSVSREALRRLLQHPWPGNVRELAHVIERGVILAAGTEIQERDLVGLPELTTESRAATSGEVVTMIEVQRRYARWAYQHLGSQKLRTAERLDVDVKTLNKWLADDDRNH